MLTSHTKFTFFALCPSSHFQYMNGVEDLRIVIGGRMWLMLTSHAKIYIFYIMPKFACST